MYVVPTPFRIAEGLAHHHTLILPSHIDAESDFIEVGSLVRTEAEKLIIGYSFGLHTNELLPKKVPNPDVGKTHSFRAWRLKGSPTTPAVMYSIQSISIEDEPNE